MKYLKLRVYLGVKKLLLGRAGEMDQIGYPS